MLCNKLGKERHHLDFRGRNSTFLSNLSTFQQDFLCSLGRLSCILVTCSILTFSMDNAGKGGVASPPLLCRLVYTFLHPLFVLHPYDDDDDDLQL